MDTQEKVSETSSLVAGLGGSRKASDVYNETNSIGAGTEIFREDPYAPSTSRVLDPAIGSSSHESH